MARRNVPGTVYLLHFSVPYKHARHYTGWASDLAARLAEHDDGRGARLTAVAKAAGITWTLARTWPGTRARERQLKNQGGASRHCPACKKESKDMSSPEAHETQLARAREADQRPLPAAVYELAPGDYLVEGPGPDPLLEQTAGHVRNEAERDRPWGAEASCDDPGSLTAAGLAEADADCKRALDASGAEQDAADGIPASLAFTDASRRVTAMYAAGVGLERISQDHDDLAASLVTDAQTPPGRAYAREYADTGRTLIADLREDAAVARGQSAAACTLPDGTPHPDPVLAARGWQVGHGIYQRTGSAAAARAREPDREAG
jgi:predicted GIY-YIG superfamily endonuclease